MDINKERGLINYLRGLAIIFMLWGHSIQYCQANQFDFFDNIIFKFIYSFHMPFFMLISGFLFFFSEQKRSIVELIEYKSKTLLYPILMCSIINHFFTRGISSIFKGEFIEAFEAPVLTNLWFLWSVLASCVILAIAVKTSRNIIIQGILIILGIVVVAVFPCGKMNVYMYPYFVIGYLFAKNEKKFVTHKNIYGITSIIVFVVMLIFFEKKHLIYTSGLLGGKTILDSLFIDLFRWVIGLFGSIAIVFIGTYIYNQFLGKRVIRFIERVGAESLAVYTLSISLLSFWLPKLASTLLNIFRWVNWNDCIWVYNLIVTPCVAIIYSMVLMCIIKLLRKKGIYRFVFGR